MFIKLLFHYSNNSTIPTPVERVLIGQPELRIGPMNDTERADVEIHQKATPAVRPCSKSERGLGRPR